MIILNFVFFIARQMEINTKACITATNSWEQLSIFLGNCRDADTRAHPCVCVCVVLDSRAAAAVAKDTHVEHTGTAYDTAPTTERRQKKGEGGGEKGKLAMLSYRLFNKTEK